MLRKSDAAKLRVTSMVCCSLNAESSSSISTLIVRLLSADGLNPKAYSPIALKRLLARRNPRGWRLFQMRPRKAGIAEFCPPRKFSV